MCPKLIVGLGNPGKEYAKTRHNIGEIVVSRLDLDEGVSFKKAGFQFSQVARKAVSGREVILALPQTFMNRSGLAVSEVKDFFKVLDQELLVVHDDLDLSLGRVKLDFKAGAAGHRGVDSVIESLGTKAFYRLRLGIGRPERKEEVENFVLTPFKKEEQVMVDRMIQEGKKLIESWITA